METKTQSRRLRVDCGFAMAPLLKLRFFCCAWRIFISGCVTLPKCKLSTLPVCSIRWKLLIIGSFLLFGFSSL